MTYSSRFLWVLALLILLPALAFATDGDVKSEPQIYDYNGAPVSPLCFLSSMNDWEREIVSYSTSGCDEGYRVVDEAPISDEYVSVAYEEIPKDDADRDEYPNRGIIGYRAVGMVKNKAGEDELAVMIVENAGGSGVFSSLILLKIDRDDATKETRLVRTDIIAGGDRCNGGLVDAWIEDGRVLAFKVHTTMYDMMSLTDDPERPIMTEGKGNALFFCAACCYGEAEYDTDEFRSISFTDDRMKPDEEDNEPTQCVENLISLNIEHGQNTFGKEEWESMTREIEHVCLGRVEGE